MDVGLNMVDLSECGVKSLSKKGGIEEGIQALNQIGNKEKK